MHYVVQIDPRTGITLRLDGTHANGDAHWYPFESQSAAEAFCAERLRERPDSGWVVFGEDRKRSLGEYVDRDYWNARPSSQARTGFWRSLVARFRR